MSFFVTIRVYRPYISFSKFENKVLGLLFEHSRFVHVYPSICTYPFPIWFIYTYIIFCILIAYMSNSLYDMHFCESQCRRLWPPVESTPLCDRNHGPRANCCALLLAVAAGAVVVVGNVLRGRRWFCAAVSGGSTWLPLWPAH